MGKIAYKQRAPLYPVEKSQKLLITENGEKKFLKRIF